MNFSNMWRHCRMKSLLIASICVSISIAVPLSTRLDVDYPVDSHSSLNGRTNIRCSNQCPDRTLPWAYEQGTTYTYSYSVDSVTSIKGTSEQESKMGLKATVHITVNSPCDLSLKISEASLTAGDNTEFSKLLTKHDLHFSFIDGQVIDVCSNPEETTAVLNIKKGILSAFQVSSEDWTKSQNVTETDVTGVCSTQYISAGGNLGRFTLVKSKDMQTCVKNQKLFQFALNLPDLNIQHLSLIKTDHNCEISLVDGILSKTVCEESHLFKPFSSGDHGVTTSQEQILEFVSSRVNTNSALYNGAMKKGNLLFDHEDDVQNIEVNQRIVQKILEEFPISPESSKPEIFTSLVHSLRHLPHAQLTHLFYSIKDFQTRKFVLDAIPILRTDAAVRLMRDIVTSGDLSDATVDAWFASLSFYKNPTRAMISTVSNFLDVVPRKSALLAVSSLVRTFCESQPDCQLLPEVQDVIFKYESYLGADCTGNGLVLSQEDEDRIILSLKALRNIGKFVRSGPVLEQCYLSNINSIYIRMAALETLKTLSCLSKAYEPKLIETFSNTDLDSELRIGAYIALMNCPTESTVETVKSVLTIEPVNQVGSFVWTHLTNLQESQSRLPSKIMIKRLVGDQFLQNKWNTDVRKFSRYFETSYYANELQVGATLEGNIVFSQESYLPRSAMANLSINVFGENLNLLEVGGRAEGFETLVEGMFGPDGRFREDTFHKLLQGMRAKRDASNIAEFQSTFNKIREDTPKGNFYVRTFGRDAHYSSFHGLNDLINKVAFWPQNFLGSGSDGIDFHRSSIFLDGGIVVPTASGLPLKLSVNGTNSVGLKSSTRFDISKLMSEGKLSAEAHIYPSATVQVTGVMEISAGNAKTGVKSVTKLHSNTFLDGKVLVDGGKLAKVELNMPRDTMEILEASADFYTWQARSGDTGEDSYEPIVSDNAQDQFTGCVSEGADILGVELCATAKYHFVPENDLALYFTGPSLAKISLKKTDHFQKYVFEYSWTSADEADSALPGRVMNDVRVTYDTPGSAVDRRSNLEVKFDNFLTFVSVGVEIPVNKINGDLVYNWTPDKKMFKAAMSVNRQSVFYFYSMFKVADNQGKYGAEARVSFYDTEFLRWIGTVVLQDSRKSIDLKMSGSFHSPLKISGDLYISPDRYDFTSNARASFVNIDFAGQLRHSPTSLALKGDFNYKIRDLGPQSIKIDASYQMSSVGKLNSHRTHITINPSQFPLWVTDLSWDTQISADYIENNGKLRVGKRAYNLEQVFSSQATDTMQELLFKVALTDIQSNTHYKLDFLHKVGESYSNNRVALSFHHYDIVAYASHKMVFTPMTSLNFSAGFQFPGGHDYAAAFEMTQAVSNEYAGSAFVRWGPVEETGNKISADFSLQKGNEAHLNYGFQIILTLPNLQTISSTGTLLIDPVAGSVLKLSLTRHSRLYSMELEYLVIELEHHVNAVIAINNKEYKAKIRAKDLETKSLSVEILSDKDVVMAIDMQAKQNFRNLQLDAFWDKSKDDSKSLSISTKLTGQELDIGFKIVGQVGKLVAELQEDGLKLEARYNEHFVKARGSHSLQSSNYGFEAELESSFEVVRDVRMIAKAVVLQSSDGTSTLDSKFVFTWNEIRHSLILTGERSLRLRADLITSSTYKPLDDCQISLNHEKNGKDQKTLIEARYKNKNVTFEMWNSNSKTKEGHLRLATPFEALRSVKAEYKLTLGREIGYVARFDHNSGANAIGIDGVGSFRAGDAKLRAKVRHTWGDDFEFGIGVRSFQSDVLVEASLLTESSRGFNVSAGYSSVSDRIVSSSAVFQLFCETNPVDFGFQFKRPRFDSFNLQTKLITSGEELFHVQVSVEGDSDGSDGNEIIADIKVLECALMIDGQATTSFDEKIEQVLRKLDTSFSMSGQPHSSFNILIERKYFFDTARLNRKFESKLNSLNLESGLSVSTEEVFSNGQVIQGVWNVSGHGLNENFASTFEKLSNAERMSGKLDLVTSFGFARHVRFEAETAQEEYEEGIANSMTLRGNWNDGSDFVLTGRYVLESKVDKTITVAYEGPSGPFLWSATLRNSIQDTLEIEYLFVDSMLKEHSAFASTTYKFSDESNFLKFYGNVSIPDSELIQATAHLQQSMGGGILVSAKILNPSVWLDTSLRVEGVEETGLSFIGQLSAPGLSFNDRLIQGSVNYGRGVIFKAGVKYEEVAAMIIESSVNLDLGTKRSTELGIHHFIKVDAKVKIDKKGRVDEKFISLSGGLSRTFQHVTFKLESSCEDFRNVELNLQFGRGQAKAEFIKNEDRISLAADTTFDSGYNLQSQVESTFHDFKKIDISAAINVQTVPHVIKISAKSEDLTYNVDISSTFESSKGSLKLTTIVPALSLNEKDFQVRYNLSPTSGDAVITTRGNVYDIHWQQAGNEISGTIATPISGFEKIELFAKTVTTNSLSSTDASVTANGILLWKLESSFDLYNYLLALKLKTPLEWMTSLEVKVGMLEKWRGVNFELSYLDENLAEARFFLDEDFMSSEVKLSYRRLYLLNLAHNLKGLDKYIRAEHAGFRDFKLDLSLNENLRKASAVLNTLWTGEHAAEAEWNVENTSGYLRLAIKCPSNEKVIAAQYTLTDLYQGTAEVEATGLPFVNDVRAFIDFNVGGAVKQVSLIGNGLDNKSLDASLTYEMTEDTFDGKVLLKSGVQGWEGTTFMAKYNIAARPSASVSYERNGAKKEIKVEVALENRKPIPTIYISTPFEGYESIVLGGDFSSRNSKYTCEFYVTQNGNKVVVSTNKVSVKPDFSALEIVSSLETPIDNWRSLYLEFGYKSSDPLAGKFKFTRDGVEYSIRGKISVADNEFRFNAITPFEDFESVGLSGKFGTTSVGKQFGVSFEQNLVKRDVSFEYGMSEDGMASLEMKAPLRNIRSVKIYSSMMNDDPQDKLSFGFETTGERSNAALGLAYDFTQGISNGRLRITVKPGQLFENIEELDLNLDLSELNDEYSGKLTFNMNGAETVSAQTRYRTGHASALIRTPVPDYETILLEFDSDLGSKMNIIFELNDKSSSLEATRTSPDHIQLVLKTPFAGYEQVTANYDVASDGTIKVLVKRSEVVITNLKIKADMNLNDGSINIDWKATNNIWAKLSAEYDVQGKVNFHLETASSRLKLAHFFYELSAKEPKVFNKFNFKFNDYYLDYDSESTMIFSSSNTDSWEGLSKLVTNIEIFGSRVSETRYKYQYSKDFSLPFILMYSQVQDGRTVVDFDSSLEIDLTRGFDLKIHFFVERISPDVMSLKCTFGIDLTAAQKTGKLSSSFSKGDASHIFAVEFRITDKDLIFIAKSNNEAFKEFKGRVAWSVEGNKTKQTVQLVLNGSKFAQGSIIFDQNPFTRVVVTFQRDETTKQEVDFRWVPVETANGRYHLSLKGKGIAEFNFDVSTNIEETSAKVEVIVMVNSPLGSYDSSATVVVKFGPGAYEIDIKTQNNRENRERRVKAGVKLQSPLAAGVSISGVSLPFDLPSFDVTLDYDFASDEKIIKGEFRAAEIRYYLDGKINWSAEASALSIIAGGSSGRKIVFKGERSGLTSMKYSLDILGTVLKFESTNQIRSPTDFDLKAVLDIPVFTLAPHIEVKASYAQAVKETETHSLSGSLAIRQHEVFSLKFVRSTSGEFELSAQTPIPKIGTIELRHDHIPNKKAVDGYDNQYELKWREDNAITLHYNKIGDMNFMRLEVLLDNQKLASFSYKLRYVPGTKIFDLNVDTNSPYFNVNLSFHSKDDASFTFSAEGTSALVSQDVVIVTATYTARKMLQFTFKQGPKEASLQCTYEPASGNGGDLKIEFGNNFSAKIQKVIFDGSVVYEKLKKSATLTLQVDSKTFALEAGVTPDELDLLISTPVPGIEYLKFETDFERGKYSAELEYGKKGTPSYLDVDIEMNNQAADVKFFKFEANRMTGSYSLSGEIDFASMAFSCEAAWAGKSVTLTTHYEDGTFHADLKTPFTNFEDVRFEGEWEKTANGGNFKGLGDVNSVKHAFDASYVSTENGMTIKWKASKGAADEIAFELISKNEGTKSFEAKLSLTGTRFRPFVFEGKYRIGQNSFGSDFRFVTPYNVLPEGKASVLVNFVHPSSYEFKSFFETDEQKVFDVDMALSLEASNHKFLRFGATVPSLGIDENDLKVEFGYKVVSANDFEIVGEATIAGTPRKIALKYSRYEKKIDGELTLELSTRKLQFKFGGEVTPLSTEGHTLNAYINDCTLEISHDKQNFAAKFVVDLQNKLFGVYDVTEAGLPDLIVLEMRYDHLQSARLALNVGREEPRSLHGAVTFGNSRVIAEVVVNTPPTGHKSASMVIGYGAEGRFEVTLSDEEGTHRLELGSMSRKLGRRHARAAVYSSSIGNYQFELDRETSSGIIVLTTTKGLHKVSYDIKYSATNDFEVDIQMESPFLNNGHANAKLTVNGKSHNYRAAISVNNDHFVSGSFVVVGGGFETSFGIQSVALSSDFQVGLAYSNDENESSGSVTVQIFSEKHEVKYSMRKDRPYAKLAVSSPLLPWLSLDVEADLKKEGQDYTLVSAGKVGSRSVQINGELSVNDCLDFSGKIYFFGSGLSVSEARLDYRLKISSSENVFNVFVTSDHPTLSEARFAITAEIVPEGTGSVVLISVLTPFSQFENLSGKISFPHLNNGLPKNSIFVAQVQIPNLGFHKIEVNLDEVSNLVREAKVVYFNDNGQPVVLKGSLTGPSISLNVELKTQYEVLSTGKLTVSFFDGDETIFDSKLEWNENFEASTKLAYQIRSGCKYITAELVLPNGQKYSIDLGRRKCAAYRAHLATPNGGLGAKISYLFENLMSHDLEAEVDLTLLPYEWVEYKVISFRSSLVTEPLLEGNFKLALNEYSISGTLETALIGSNIRQAFTVAANNNLVQGSFTSSPSASNYGLNLAAQIPSLFEGSARGNVEYSSSSEILVDLQYNTDNKIYFAINNEAKGFEIRNVYRSVGIKYRDNSFLDTDKIRNVHQVEICWDTNHAESETERFELRGYSDVYHGHSYDVTALWRNNQTSTFAVANLKSALVFGKISYAENDETVFVIQSEEESFYVLEKIAKLNTKYSITLPDRFFSLEIIRGQWKLREYEVKLSFGLQSDLPNIKGISFSHSTDFEGDLYFTDKYTLRRLDSTSGNHDHSAVLTIRKEGDNSAIGEVSRLIRLKIDHPTDDNLRLEIKVQGTKKISDSKFELTTELMKKIASEPEKATGLVFEVDREHLTADGVLLTWDRSSYNFKGKVVRHEHSLILESVVTKDGHEFADLIADISAKVPSVQAQSRIFGLNFFAGLQNDKEFVISFVRTQKIPAQKLEDFNIYARLTTEDAINIGATWRPELKDDLQRYFDSSFSHMSLCPMVLTWSEIETGRSIMDSFQSSVFVDLLTVLEEPLSGIQETFMQFVQNVKSLKIHENFYVQIATDYLEKSFTCALEFSSHILKKTFRFATISIKMVADLSDAIFVHMRDLLAGLAECGSQACSKLTSYFSRFEFDANQFSAHLDSIVLTMKRGLELFVEWYHNTVDDHTIRATEFLRDLAKNIKKDVVIIVVRVTGFLKQFRIVNDALEFYYQYRSWFEELHFSQHLENFIKHIEQSFEGPSEHFQTWKENICQAWKQGIEFFSSKFERITEYPIFAYVSAAAKRVYKVSAAIIEQFSIDTQLRKMSERVFGQIDSVVSVVVRIVDVIYGRRDMFGYVLEYKPESGILSYHQVLPFRWYSFKELPDLLKTFEAFGTDPDAKSDFSFLDFQHDLLDAIHTISTALATRSLVPPFSARAMIAGDYHIMTFDNKFYDFSGSQGCSYLLMSDFLHNRFSVVANYEQDQKRTSLTVISDEKRIDIETKPSSDEESMKVSIDRRVVELPQVFLSTIIKREGSSLILENSEGLRVNCNLAQDICTVTVSGWYFGKTGGLFGVYDYEPSNDWMTPERRIASKLQDFASSWQIDKSTVCPVNIKVPDTSILTANDRLRCSDLFGGENSALMPCYTTVDVAPFHRLCLTDAARQETTGVCSAAAAYIEQCRLSGVELWMPSVCVKCSSPAGQFMSGESMSYQNDAPLSADVVFLVEQASCLNSYSMSDLPMVIDREMTTRGFSDNRFAIVGFGGPGKLSLPHVITSASMIFSDAVKTSASMNRMKTTGNGGDVFAGLKYAGRLAFRPGVSKSIILVSCSSGTDGSFYGDAMTMLSEQAITMHHVTSPSVFQWRGSRSRSIEKIFGISKMEAYTLRNINVDKGDAVLRRQLRNPKDFLSTLALESGGVVFSIEKFESDQAIEAKKAATILAIQVSLRAEPAPCQVCDCVADRNGVGRLQCHKCILPAMDIVLKNWEEYKKLWNE